MLWQAHINVQYVTITGLSKYVMKYVMKLEPQSIVSVVDHADNHVRSHLQSRRIGVMKIMCLLNSKLIIKLSSCVEFLTNTASELRMLTIHHVHEIERNLEESYYPNSVDKYFARPVGSPFKNLTYPNYFRQFKVESRHQPPSRVIGRIMNQEE